jgi:putative heme iron utilization protein
MDDAQIALLRAVVAAQPVAALATLHHGEPATSMTPYAWLPEGGELVLHVSRLATHTADMQAHATVSLLVVGPADMAETPLALPRLSVQGEARTCLPEDPRYAAARSAYLARFPDAEPLFGFGDFSLVLVQPQHLRFVGGFGRAHAVSLAAWGQALALLPGDLTRDPG